MLYEIHAPTLLEVHLPKKKKTPLSSLLVLSNFSGSIHSKPLSSNKRPENIKRLVLSLFFTYMNVKSGVRLKSNTQQNEFLNLRYSYQLYFFKD